MTVSTEPGETGRARFSVRPGAGRRPLLSRWKETAATGGQFLRPSVVKPPGLPAGLTAPNAGPPGLTAGPAAPNAGPASLTAGPAAPDAGPPGLTAEPAAPNAGPPGLTAEPARRLQRLSGPITGYPIHTNRDLRYIQTGGYIWLDYRY